MNSTQKTHYRLLYVLCFIAIMFTIHYDYFTNNSVQRSDFHMRRTSLFFNDSSDFLDRQAGYRVGAHCFKQDSGLTITISAVENHFNIARSNAYGY